MRDFKYRELVIGDDAAEKTAMSALAIVNSPHLKECAGAFKANLERTLYFQGAPHEIAFQSRRDAIFQFNAINRATGNTILHLMEFVNAELTPEIDAEFISQAQELEASGSSPQYWLRYELGILYIEGLLASGNAGMQITMDAIFGAIVLESWTAFECLCGDLWCALVNNGKKEFRQKVQRSPEVKKRQDAISEMTPDSELDPVLDYAGYLREERMVNFQTFSNIKKYYAILFDKPTIESLFGGKSDYIIALAQVRNVLTHKAGIADKTFVTHASAFPELSTFKEGQKIELDGLIVKKLRAAGVTVGNALICHVDKLLSEANP